MNDGRAEARRLLNEAERSIGGAAQEPEAPPPTRPARAGDTVELVSMGTRASVLSVNKDGTLQLQAGILKITAKQDEVRVVEGETQSQKEARRIVQRAQHTLRAAAAPSEIDLRGMMTDEAIAVLDRFLDTAMTGQAGERDHHPWKGDRRGAQGGAGAFEEVLFGFYRVSLLTLAIRN